MLDLMYDLPDREGLVACTLTAETLRTGKPELRERMEWDLEADALPFDLVTGKRRAICSDAESCAQIA